MSGMGQGGVAGRASRSADVTVVAEAGLRTVERERNIITERNIINERGGHTFPEDELTQRMWAVEVASRCFTLKASSLLSSAEAILAYVLTGEVQPEDEA